MIPCHESKKKIRAMSWSVIVIGKRREEEEKD